MMKWFDHKNIVKLLGVCTRGEPVYAVMEFMLHGTLCILCNTDNRDTQEFCQVSAIKLILLINHQLFKAVEATLNKHLDVMLDAGRPFISHCFASGLR